MNPLKKKAADLRRDLEARGYQRPGLTPMFLREFIELHPTLFATDSVAMQRWIPSWTLTIAWWAHDAHIPQDLVLVWLKRAEKDLDFRSVLLAFAMARVDFDSDIEGMLS